MGATSNLLFAPYRLDLQNEQLWRADDLIPLRAKPFALLRYMAENPARLVLHEELRKAIWPTTYVSEGVLRVYLREVRAALEDNSESPRFIETIARRGYRFLAEVERVTATGTSKVAGGEIQTHAPRRRWSAEMWNWRACEVHLPRPRRAPGRSSFSPEKRVSARPRSSNPF